MEHVHPVDRSFSWRGAALAVVLLLVIALAGLGGMALVHRLGAVHSTPANTQIERPPPTHARPAVSLRPRSAVSVLVLNGNGVNGAAGSLATRLFARGYRHSAATDAASLGYARSVVLFRPGWGGEAERLAHDAGVTAVAPLDGTIAPAYAHDQLVVILGR
ncbi:MAG TPA: LytR C-terminal domain-containing protein [Gaiellaceae bacterium]|nr:LytR C-terminal domain-containing protein [Gaiellaceae bacterium]